MYPRNMKKNSKDMLLEALNQSNTQALMKELLVFKGFDTAQVDGIFKVVQSTPNPPVALQVILGLYKEPRFNRLSYIRNKECFFLGYEALAYEDDQISYTCREPKATAIWYDPREYLTTDDNGTDVMPTEEFIHDDLQKQLDHGDAPSYTGEGRQNIRLVSNSKLITTYHTCSPRAWIRGLNDESNPADLRTKLDTHSADPKTYQFITYEGVTSNESMNQNWKR